MARWGLAAVVLGLAPVGCTEYGLPPVRYETERAIVGTAFDSPLCGADIAFIDGRIAALETSMRVRREEPVEIYLYDDRDALPCTQGALGCYAPREDIVVSLWELLDHELVHAVTTHFDYRSAFWQEGLAVALSVEGTHRNPGVQLQSWHFDRYHSRDVDYPTAGHFVRFLIEAYGIEPVLAVAGGASAHEEFGLSKTELARAYETQAPFSYPAWEPCQAPAIAQVDAGRWAQDVRFSCESGEATRFAGPGASVTRTLTLDEPGTYTITVTGGAGATIVGCQMHSLGSPPPDFAHGDVQSEAEAFGAPTGTFLPAGVTHALDVTAGTYRVALSSGTEAAETVSIAVERAP